MPNLVICALPSARSSLNCFHAPTLTYRVILHMCPVLDAKTPAKAEGDALTTFIVQESV